MYACQRVRRPPHPCTSSTPPARTRPTPTALSVERNFHGRKYSKVTPEMSMDRLHRAIQRPKLPDILRELTQAVREGADINQKIDGETLLKRVNYYDKYNKDFKALTEALFGLGAKIDFSEYHEGSPLHDALYFSDPLKKKIDAVQVYAERMFVNHLNKYALAPMDYVYMHATNEEGREKIVHALNQFGAARSLGVLWQPCRKGVQHIDFLDMDSSDQVEIEGKFYLTPKLRWILNLSQLFHDIQECLQVNSSLSRLSYEQVKEVVINSKVVFEVLQGEKDSPSLSEPSLRAMVVTIMRRSIGLGVSEFLIKLLEDCDCAKQRSILDALIKLQANVSISSFTYIIRQATPYCAQIKDPHACAEFINLLEFYPSLGRIRSGNFCV